MSSILVILNLVGWTLLLVVIGRMERVALTLATCELIGSVVAGFPQTHAFRSSGPGFKTATVLPKSAVQRCE